MCKQHVILEYDEGIVPFIDVVPSSTITCHTNEDYFVGTASLSTLQVYEVNNNDIELCFHKPKIIPKI